MSKLESSMIRWYWQQAGGTLIEEFPAVRRRKDRGQRLIDGIILPEGEHKIAYWKDVSIEGNVIIVVQTKRGRLGMYLMGQTFFSVELMKRFNPKSIKSVALCEKYDAVLGPMIEKYPVIEVVLYLGDDRNNRALARVKTRCSRMSKAVEQPGSLAPQAQIKFPIVGKD